MVIIDLTGTASFSDIGAAMPEHMSFLAKYGRRTARSAASLNSTLSQPSAAL